MEFLKDCPVMTGDAAAKLRLVKRRGISRANIGDVVVSFELPQLNHEIWYKGIGVSHQYCVLKIEHELPPELDESYTYVILTKKELIAQLNRRNSNALYYKEKKSLVTINGKGIKVYPIDCLRGFGAPHSLDSRVLERAAKAGYCRGLRNVVLVQLDGWPDEDSLAEKSIDVAAMSLQEAYDHYSCYNSKRFIGAVNCNTGKFVEDHYAEDRLEEESEGSHYDDFCYDSEF